MLNHRQPHQWNLFELRADAVVIRDESARIHTLLMGEIAGYGTTFHAQNGAPDRVDVILTNGDRYRIGSARPRDLAQALDARLG